MLRLFNVIFRSNMIFRGCDQLTVCVWIYCLYIKSWIYMPSRLSSYSSLTSWLSGGKDFKSRRGTAAVQPWIVFNSGKYDQILPVVFWENSGIFPGRGEENTERAWLYSRLCKHGMALITDAYFGVTSEAAAAVCISALSLRLQPAWGKEHAKSITQFLSVFLLKERLLPFCIPVLSSCNCCEGNSSHCLFFSW